MRPLFVVLTIVAIGPWVARTSAADAKAVESALTQWIGTSKDGWTPIRFAALRSGMLPAEVGQQFPGAEKLRGIASKVKVAGIPHVQEIQFNFLTTRPDGQKGLDGVILTFDRGFFDDKASYDALVRVLEAKYGPMRPGPNTLARGFWQYGASDKVRGSLPITAQLINWGPGQDLQLSFGLPAGPAQTGTVTAAPKPAASVDIFTTSSCRAVEATEDKADKVIAEASAASGSECRTALKEKLKAARCTGSTTQVTYRLQTWAVGRWSNGARLTLSCR